MTPKFRSIYVKQSDLENSPAMHLLINDQGKIQWIYSCFDGDSIGEGIGSNPDGVEPISVFNELIAETCHKLRDMILEWGAEEMTITNIKLYTTLYNELQRTI